MTDGYFLKRPTRRTYWLIKFNNDWRHSFDAVRKITCEVTGEIANGVKVWTDVETGEQYYCSRLLGTYYFYKI